MLSSHALAKFQFPHDNGILEHLHVINAHERHLLRVVTSKLRSPKIIKIRIGRIMPDQHPPERGRDHFQAVGKGYNRAETNRQGGKRRSPVIRRQVIRVQRVSGLQGNTPGGIKPTIVRVQFRHPVITEKALGTNTHHLVLVGEKQGIIVEILVPQSHFEFKVTQVQAGYSQFPRVVTISHIIRLFPLPVIIHVIVAEHVGEVEPSQKGIFQ